jgi:predicted Na+-dependent transporter
MIALEACIQNGPLGVLIVTLTLTFTGAQQHEVLLMPVLYSLFILLTGSFVTIWIRKITNREEQVRAQCKIGGAAA